MNAILTDPLLREVVECSLKAALLLSAVGVLAKRWRRASAGALHGLWLAGLLAAALLPLLSLTLPRVGVALPALAGTPSAVATPDQLQPSPVPPPATVARSEVAPDHDTGQPQSIAANVHPLADPSADPAVLPSTAAPGPASAPPPAALPLDASSLPPAADRIFTASQLLLTCWLPGVACLVLHALAARLLLARLRRAAVPASPLIQRQAGDLARDLGLPSAPPVRIVPETVPLLCGILRPTILLPPQAETWTTQRRRLVLLHELAHLQRRDLWTMLLARLILCLYWFHPLVWLAFARTRQLAERACDDVVLHQGAPAADYAQELLHIARAARRPNLAGAAAMARRDASNLENRLMAILDSTRTRRPITRKTLIALILAAALPGVPLAVVQAETKEPATAAASGGAVPVRAAEAGQASAAGATAEGSTLQVYQLKHASAAAVSAAVSRAYPGISAGVDGTANTLVISTTGAIHDRVAALISALDSAGGGPAPAASAGAMAIDPSSGHGVEVPNAVTGRSPQGEPPATSPATARNAVSVQRAPWAALAEQFIQAGGAGDAEARKLMTPQASKDVQAEDLQALLANSRALGHQQVLLHSLRARLGEDGRGDGQIGWCQVVSIATRGGDPNARRLHLLMAPTDPHRPDGPLSIMRAAVAPSKDRDRLIAQWIADALASSPLTEDDLLLARKPAKDSSTGEPVARKFLILAAAGRPEVEAFLSPQAKVDLAGIEVHKLFAADAAILGQPETLYQRTYAIAPTQHSDPAKRHLVMQFGAIGDGTWKLLHARFAPEGSSRSVLHRWLREEQLQGGNQVATIPSPAGGMVAKVLVKENQPVKAGDILVQLDPTELHLRIEQANLALQLAHVDLKQVAALRKENAATEFQVQQSETKLVLAESELRLLQLQLDRRTIRSPVTGVVGSVRALAGLAVKEGDELARIVYQAEVWTEPTPAPAAAKAAP